MTDSKPSKSARKREHRALQELGEKLIALREDELASLSLDDRLRKAVSDARTIKSHGALRRQKQLIGKLMRQIDPQPIRAAIAHLAADELHEKRLFSRAEQWRDRIANEGDAGLDAFESETGTTDAELRSLLQDLEVAFDDRRHKTVRRQIFRRVHKILVRISQ